MTGPTEGSGRVRLYHERHRPSESPLGPADEEECFTSRGRLVGVWLTTEPLQGEVVLAGEVDVESVAAFEVASDAPSHRQFVVPAAVAADLGLRAS